jgi:hypothetical protein
MAMFGAPSGSGGWMHQPARSQPIPVRVDHDNISIGDISDVDVRHIAIDTPPGVDMDVKEHIKALNRTILEMYTKLSDYKKEVAEMKKISSLRLTRKGRSPKSSITS